MDELAGVYMTTIETLMRISGMKDKLQDTEYKIDALVETLDHCHVYDEPMRTNLQAVREALENCNKGLKEAEDYMDAVKLGLEYQ